MRALVDAMRAWNRGRSSDHQVGFYGFEIPSAGHAVSVVTSLHDSITGPALKAWLANAGLHILSDRVPGRDAAAAVVPIEGEVGRGAQAQLWPTIWGVLRNAFATGRVAHAFMLTGVRGVGKTTTARIIARALNCTGADDTGGPTASREADAA